MLYKLFLALLLLFLAGNLFADDLSNPIASPATIADNILDTKLPNLGVANNLIKPSAPKTYKVRYSDTIVKLAHMYLTKINYWQSLLGLDINRKAIIYPGDILELIYKDGTTILAINKATKVANSDNGYVKLEPQIRTTAYTEIPTLSMKSIKNLLLDPFVMDPDTFYNAPQVVAGEAEDRMYTLGDVIYVAGYNGQVGDKISLFSRFRSLSDPDTNESLGFEVHYNGDAIIDQVGPVSSLHLVKAINAVANGNRVFLAIQTIVPDIYLRQESMVITGKIIAIYDAISSTAQYNTVVINRGTRDGIKVGQVFNITDTRREKIPELNPDISSRLNLAPDTNRNSEKTLILPPRIVGEMIIYKAYDKVSFAIITDSSQAILVNALVQTQQ